MTPAGPVSRRWVIAAWVAAAVLAWPLLPMIDLTVSGWAFRPDGGGFWLKDSWPVTMVYRDTRYFTTGIVLSLVAVIAYGLASRADASRADASRADASRALARRAALALLAVALGPGLVVQTLKETIGRPRPVQITNFGGAGRFVPAGIPSDQCQHNCSFTSGHAASGFSLIAGLLLWPARRRRWLLVGIVAGTFIGACRILQGAHFFSDVLGSGLLVWGTVSILERWARSRGGSSPTTIR